MQSVKIRPATASDREWIAKRLIASWGSAAMALRGELIDPLDHEALLTTDKSGLLIHRDIAPNGTEVVVIETFEPGIGIGKALMVDLIELARARKKSFVSVVTTNDNTGALRFYQKLGFRLYDLKLNAVDAARRELKPEIPETGHDDIPIHDEIELRLSL